MWALAIVVIILGAWGRSEYISFKKTRKKKRLRGYLQNPLWIDIILSFRKPKRSTDSYTGYYMEYKHLFGKTYITKEGFETPRKAV